jgi:hypothetical protein
VITTAVAAKLIAPLAGAALRQVAKSAGSAFLSRNKLRLPPRKSASEINEFVLKITQQEVKDTDLSQELLEYLQSPDCTTFVEHLICFRATGRDVREDGPLKRELETGAKRHGADVKAETDSLFRILLGVVEFILEHAGVTGTEDVHEKSQKASADQAIEVYLRSIDAQIELLTRPSRIDLARLDGALSHYCTAMQSVIGKIQPPNFDGTDQVDTDKLFVTPTIESSTSGQIFTLNDLVAAHRCVILGDPGGGKTTLSRKLALDILTARIASVDRMNLRLVPFIIVLRDFGNFLKRNPGSVAEFLSESVRSTFQTQLTAEEVEYLLTVGRAYVIFDGLDELLEPTDRKKVAEIVTAFSAKFTSVGILVTSRRVGYLQAPLQSDSFTTLSLTGFDEEQVEQYVANWFSLISELPEERRAELIASFVRDSNGVPELQASPLMLALMCTIYRFEGYIPRNRPDVYEKCSKMLFDRWDRHRGLREQFDFEAHIEPALMSLAYTIYLDTNLQSGVTEANLVSLAADYLDEWQYGNRALAEQAASKFVGFCRGRAWVFSDVGLTPEGDSLYAFTHRTFLEFFAASHLTRTCVTLDALVDELRERVCSNEWDVVAQLALQIKAKASQGGPDFAASSLVAIASNESNVDRCRNVAAFLSRCLAFLPLSPKCASSVGSDLIRITIESYVTQAQEEEPERKTPSNELTNVVEGIRESAREVRNALLDSTMAAVIDLLNEADDSAHGDLRKEVAASVAWSLDRRYDGVDPSLEERRVQLAERFRTAARDHLGVWNSWVAVVLYWRRDINVDELTELIPIESVRFTAPQLGMHSFLQPLFSSLRDVAASEHVSNPENFLRSCDMILRYAGQIRDRAPLARCELAGTKNGIFESLLWESRVHPETVACPVSAEVVVAFTLVLAFVSEAQGSDIRADRKEELRALFGPLAFILDIVDARSGEDEVPAELLHKIPASDGRELIEAWARRDLNLIQSADN